MSKPDPEELASKPNPLITLVPLWVIAGAIILVLAAVTVYITLSLARSTT
jgi:hypothetical protein